MARLRTVKENYYARIRHTGINEITIPLKTKMYKDALLRLKEVELYEPLIINGEKVLEINAEPVTQVIDTTGAGDLFAAGFLYGMTHQKNLEESGRLASIAAAEIISHYGVRPRIRLSSLI